MERNIKVPVSWIYGTLLRKTTSEVWGNAMLVQGVQTGTRERNKKGCNGHLPWLEAKDT